MNKDTLVRNFSRYAHLYDGYASIQRRAAHELVKDLPREGIEDILELGCGTGAYTYLLKNIFTDARLTAVDISNEMIEMAKNRLRDGRITFAVYDAEEIIPAGRFDLVTSNAALQWFEDPERAIGAYRDALKKNGVMAFSTFGPATFRELGEILRAVLGEDVEIGSGGFLVKDGLEKILKTSFRSVAVRERVIKERYPSLMGLLRAIKYTGTRGPGLKEDKFAWSGALLGEAEALYRKRFGGIEASYQIFFCRAAV